MLIGYFNCTHGKFQGIICKDTKVMKFQSSKMGQILFLKKVPFCKSGYILAQNTSDFTVPMVKIICVPTTVYLAKLHVHPNH